VEQQKRNLLRGTSGARKAGKPSRASGTGEAEQSDGGSFLNNAINSLPF